MLSRLSTIATEQQFVVNTVTVQELRDFELYRDSHT